MKKIFANKSFAISIGAGILFFALIGLKDFATNYISEEQITESLTPVPFLIYETANKFFTEKNPSEVKPSEKNLEEGLILYHQGKYQESINFYTEYLEKYPDDEVAYNRRGNVYFLKLKKYEAAIKDYNRALQINPNYWKPYYNRGNVYAALENYEAAIKDYNRAIELNPNFSGAYENRNICYLQLGEIKKTFTTFVKMKGF